MFQPLLRCTCNPGEITISVNFHSIHEFLRYDSVSVFFPDFNPLSILVRYVQFSSSETLFFGKYHTLPRSGLLSRKL